MYCGVFFGRVIDYIILILLFEECMLGMFGIVML